MRNAQNSLDLDLSVKKTLLLVTCIQVAPSTSLRVLLLRQIRLLLLPHSPLLHAVGCATHGHSHQPSAANRQRQQQSLLLCPPLQPLLLLAATTAATSAVQSVASSHCQLRSAPPQPPAHSS